MAKSPEEHAHLEWLGYVQPIGLVVSVPALLDAQCYVNKNIASDHARFLDCLIRDEQGETTAEIRDLAELFERAFGWEPDDLSEPTADELHQLEVVLPQYNETLRPSHVVRDLRPQEGQSPFLMLVKQYGPTIDLDEESDDSARHWSAAPHAKFERLLRETGVPIGLLTNRRQLRLVYAPRGESSGYATFDIAEMTQVAGRPIFAALHMLLSAERLFTLGDDQRLPAILENSRKYQNTVSTKLAEQVLAALYELMRGFQAANDARSGDLLREVLQSDPNHVYAGLLTTLMRLVFVMYAEDRDLLSSDPVYANHYSVTGLYARLREENGRYPDTMDQRYGAWSQLVTLFRLVYEGGSHGDFRIPPRKGYLFDPDRYPFLEGRQRRTSRDTGEDDEPTIPRVSDGVVFRVLDNLLVLDGERISYRSLDVEQIGSVYETVMGFNLEVAGGRSIAIKPVKSHGAPATINLEALLDTTGKDRAKWLKEHADQKLTGKALTALKAADSIDALLEALDKKIQKKVTPRVVPEGHIILQPSDERRRTGAHYTPRSLTEPIVRTTLEPILKQLLEQSDQLSDEEQAARDALEKLKANPKSSDTKRRKAAEAVEKAKRKAEQANAAAEKQTPHPAQILDLKVCDPAMGSGAFLVEACRQLGDELVKSWYAHECVPAAIPPDEDELLYARRLVAQRCLYGVDKNPMAVDLAKLSLWLVTLAKDHPFTFLDHSLRHGDSLVGLTRQQIIGFHWDPKKQKSFGEEKIQKRLDRATEARTKILEAREDVPYRDQEQRLALADDALNAIRLTGDACVSAFFTGSKKKEREERCNLLRATVTDWYADGLNPAKSEPIREAAASLLSGEHPVPPFHWEVEFPEVFACNGFDAFVGNPPFAGKNTIANSAAEGFLDWLKTLHKESHGNSDIVAHFFRRTFDHLRDSGSMGLIATNTIGQGDTRHTGLRWICNNGGTIISATRRKKWPGLAAVVVSVIHIVKGHSTVQCCLDGRPEDLITAYLFHSGGNDNPASLRSNANLSFQGPIPLGMGFTFDDTNGDATPLVEMHRLVEANPRNSERIFPYLGGDEILNDPRQLHRRFVISFGDMDESAARRWPDLVDILERKVRPEREKNKRKVRREQWWKFGEQAPALFRRISGAERVLVHPFTSTYVCFAFVPSDTIVSGPHNVFAIDDYGVFAVLQSQVHQVWASFFSSSLEDRLRYTPSDCFETFPLPSFVSVDTEGFLHSPSSLTKIGNECYDGRAAVMRSSDLGLTDTYNRFHDPHEKSPEIARLRELHAAMDDAVLRAYGWDDLADRATCEFLLDYEEEESDEPGAKKSNKKKPWRYRWPDDFRDEVLARLLELNAQRHKEELLAAKAEEAEKPKKKVAKKKPAKRGRKKAVPVDDLFRAEQEQAYVLMLLRAWDRPLTRHALDYGLVLMLNDDLREALLGGNAVPEAEPRTVQGLDSLLESLAAQKHVEIDNRTQQVLKLGQHAPAADTVPEEDFERLDEVKRCFERKAEAGKVTVSEEVVDADADLVPT